MRNVLLAGLTVIGFTCGALGQGSFMLDNSALEYGIALDTPGDWLSGDLGMEVWELNGTNSDFADALNFVFAPEEGYALLATNGFRLEAAYSGTAMNGEFALGTCRMPDVSPAGSTVTVALVAWNSTAPSFQATLGRARAGIIAFSQPTTYLMGIPTSPPPLAWGVNQDLVLYPLERPPAVASQPQSTNAVLGGAATFRATIGSEYEFNYHWLFNGNEIPAGTYATTVSTNLKVPQLTTYSLSLTNVQLSNSGQYSFFFATTNRYWGSWASSNASLTVTIPPPSLSIARAGQGVSLSWPAWATNYALQEATDLSGSNITWSNVEVSPVIGAHDVRLTLQPAARQSYYRLREP
jgi:hypothetical protein